MKKSVAINLQPIVLESWRYQVAMPTKPSHILEEIVWHKEKEAAQLREKKLPY